jgi:hypothetical protein
MDLATWPSWVVGALFGAVGGAVGAVVGLVLQQLTKNKSIARICQIGGIMLAVALSRLEIDKLHSQPAPQAPAAAAPTAADTASAP